MKNPPHLSGTWYHFILRERAFPKFTAQSPDLCLPGLWGCLPGCWMWSSDHLHPLHLLSVGIFHTVLCSSSLLASFGITSHDWMDSLCLVALFCEPGRIQHLALLQVYGKPCVPTLVPTATSLFVVCQSSWCPSHAPTSSLIPEDLNSVQCFHLTVIRNRA